MDQVVKKNLSVIIVATVAGIATTAFALMLVRNAAEGMSASQFSWLIFLIPCAVMFVASFVIAFSASVIGRQLYVVVLGICLFGGVVTMFVTSSWLSNEAISAALLANSPEGTVIVPILRSPMTILRDIAGFVVAPTVGLIVGAWLGSRHHPMQREKSNKGSKKK